MQRLTQFTKKVNKIISEEIKEKEKQTLLDLETKKGINNPNVQEADQYLSEKFMKFFTAKMISYFKYYKEQGVEKNEKDFQNSMKNQLISVYQHNGKVIFSTMTFKSIAEQLKLKQQTIQEQNDYIKKNLDKINMKKTIDIKEDTYKLVLYFDKLQKFQDFNTIAEKLQLVIFLFQRYQLCFYYCQSIFF